MERWSAIATVFLLIPFAQSFVNLSFANKTLKNNADEITGSDSLICAHIVSNFCVEIPL